MYASSILALCNNKATMGVPNEFQIRYTGSNAYCATNSLQNGRCIILWKKDVEPQQFPGRGSHSLSAYTSRKLANRD